MARKVLLTCGILSPILYAVSDPLGGMQWEGYSFRDQTISELGAIGAPSRTLFSVLLIVVYGLMVAFGVGVWKAAGANRRLRAVGGLLVGLGVMALAVGQFASMEANDFYDETLHGLPQRNRYLSRYPHRERTHINSLAVQTPIRRD